MFKIRDLLYPVQDFTTTMWVNGKEDTAVAVAGNGAQMPEIMMARSVCSAQAG